jgi:hypothetical protein
VAAKRQYGDDYSYTINCRLARKLLHLFVNQELPILIKHGYLTQFCKVTDNCQVSNVLVAQPGRAKDVNETENKAP